MKNFILRRKKIIITTYTICVLIFPFLVYLITTDTDLIGFLILASIGFTFATMLTFIPYMLDVKVVRLLDTPAVSSFLSNHFEITEIQKSVAERTIIGEYKAIPFSIKLSVDNRHVPSMETILNCEIDFITNKDKLARQEFYKIYNYNVHASKDGLSMVSTFDKREIQESDFFNHLNELIKIANLYNFKISTFANHS